MDYEISIGNEWTTARAEDFTAAPPPNADETVYEDPDRPSVPPGAMPVVDEE
jgi:hypothetical protein